MSNYNLATAWKVGSKQTYTLPSQVRNLVQDGDTILIDCGIYEKDATKWNKKNLKFIGLGTGLNRTILNIQILLLMAKEYLFLIFLGFRTTLTLKT